MYVHLRDFTRRRDTLLKPSMLNREVRWCRFPVFQVTVNPKTAFHLSILNNWRLEFKSLSILIYRDLNSRLLRTELRWCSGFTCPTFTTQPWLSSLKGFSHPFTCWFKLSSQMLSRFKTNKQTNIWLIKDPNSTEEELLSQWLQRFTRALDYRCCVKHL